MQKKRINTITGDDNPLLGAHLSISKGFHNAIYSAGELGCNVLQIFTKSPNSWKERLVTDDEVKCFVRVKNETGIKTVYSHTSYLINLSGNTNQKRMISREALKQEMLRASLLEIPYVVHHPGFHTGIGEKEGIKFISKGINKIFNEISCDKVRLLLETGAGQGTCIGHTFDSLAEIIDRVNSRDQIGVCIDTCHIFAAGYDIRTEKTYNNTIEQFESIIGLDKLFLLHLNDSKNTLGSKVDRHEHIGKGEIGLKAFEIIMNDDRFAGIPKIIETPKGKKGDKQDTINLEKLRSLILMNS